MAELLLELFGEEIPARMQARAATDLGRMVGERLKSAGLSFEDPRTFVTPRRLCLVIDGLPTRQPDRRDERRGPRVGAPDKALQGFLGSVGLTADQLEERETPKGAFYFAVIERKGRATADVIAELVPDVVRNFSWPKSMRWGARSLRWVRPLHSLVCLFDGAVVPIEIEDGIVSGATTKGHRFHAPEDIFVSGFDDYVAKLRAAKVMLDPAERRRVIEKGAEALAAREGLAVEANPGLLDEVTGLVEWPVPLAGSIDTRFMDVPPEVLITSMRAHQKYFPLRDKDGNLAPRFVLAANLEAPDGGAAIVAGNERVLRARLHDAKFFWDQDRKQTLESHAARLGEIVFHAKLGTVADKMARVGVLGAEIARSVPGAEPAQVARAAALCKADLLSDMVYEFPELQGIMGRYYALHDGEPEEIADAIADHYAPQGPGDACPTRPVAVALALADKLDTLAGFWAIDDKPTGSKDPFALRRAALGVIRLILENKLRLPLAVILERALAGYETLVPAGNGAALAGDLIGFFADRLKVHLRESGLRHDLLSAVFAVGGGDDLLRLVARAEALKAFLESDDGANLLAAFKRATNIVRIEEKKDSVSYAAELDPSLLSQAEEQSLHARLSETAPEISALLDDEDFTGAMKALARLRAPVDDFFDHVTVNAEDAGLRRNRLRLLSQIPAALSSVADFSLLEG